MPVLSRLLDCSLYSSSRKSGQAGRTGMVRVTPKVGLIAGSVAAPPAPQNHRNAALKASRLTGGVRSGLDRDLGIIQGKFHVRSNFRCAAANDSAAKVSLPDTSLRVRR